MILCKCDHFDDEVLETACCLEYICITCYGEADGVLENGREGFKCPLCHKHSPYPTKGEVRKMNGSIPSEMARE